MLEKKDIQKLTDEELIGLVKVSPEFFVYIVGRYEERILRYIKRISNASKETAEDLGQETFMKVYLNINQFDRKMKFTSWLYRIAHNHVISYWRKHKKDSNLIYWDEGDHFEKILESDDDIIQRVDRQLLKERLVIVINQLKPAHKEVLILKYLEDRDYQDISDILKRPIGSVGVLLTRAKAEFKEKIRINNFKLK